MRLVLVQRGENLPLGSKQRRLFDPVDLARSRAPQHEVEPLEELLDPRRIRIDGRKLILGLDIIVVPRALDHLGPENSVAALFEPNEGCAEGMTGRVPTANEYGNLEMKTMN